MNNTREVSPAGALAMIKKGALLVDVREPHEVAKKSFDVANIMLIPLREFKTRFREIPADRQVIIACNSGNRSSMAIRFLMNHGYDKAVNMQNGIALWAKEGLPVKGQPVQRKGSWLQQLFHGRS